MESRVARACLFHSQILLFLQQVHQLLAGNGILETSWVLIISLLFQIPSMFFRIPDITLLNSQLKLIRGVFLHKVNQSTGELTYQTKGVINVPAPICILFVPRWSQREVGDGAPHRTSRDISNCSAVRIDPVEGGAAWPQAAERESQRPKASWG